MNEAKAYARRWVIEEYHKALKTGARIDESRLRTAQRIQALLGVLAVVAVRLLNRKWLCTTRPQEAVEAQDVGDGTLAILEAKFGRPPETWTNRNVLRCIARLGGFIGRKSDGEPGWITTMAQLGRSSRRGHLARACCGRLGRGNGPCPGGRWRNCFGSRASRT